MMALPGSVEEALSLIRGMVAPELFAAIRATVEATYVSGRCEGLQMALAIPQLRSEVKP